MHPQVTGALAALGIEPLRITPISGDPPWRRRPLTYSVETIDGRRLKVRLLRREIQAVRATMLAEHLSDPRIPTPLARLGRVTVERWIEGQPLPTLPLTAEYLEAAADLLALVHHCPGPDGKQLPSRRRVAPLVARVWRQLNELADAGTLRAAEADVLGRLVEDHLPLRAAWGITHGDLCADNLIVGRNGDLVSVDNELLRRGFLDYDLAHTWYRWAMPGWAWDRFSHRYHEAIRPPVSSEEQRAWRVAATTKSAHLRRRTGASLGAVLQSLRDLLY